MKKNRLISQVRRGSSSQESEYTKTLVGRFSWCSLKSDHWWALLALLRKAPPDHHLLIFHKKVTWFTTCFWWEGVEFIFGMQASQISPQMSNPGISKWSGWPVRFFFWNVAWRVFLPGCWKLKIHSDPWEIQWNSAVDIGFSKCFTKRANAFTTLTLWSIGIPFVLEMEESWSLLAGHTQISPPVHPAGIPPGPDPPRRHLGSLTFRLEVFGFRNTGM